MKLNTLTTYLRLNKAIKIIEKKEKIKLTPTKVKAVTVIFLMHEKGQIITNKRLRTALTKARVALKYRQVHELLKTLCQEGYLQVNLKKIRGRDCNVFTITPMLITLLVSINHKITKTKIFT